LSMYSSMAFASLRFTSSLSSYFSSNSSSFLTSSRLSCSFSLSLSERASDTLCASRAASASKVASLISTAASSAFLEASACERSASLSFACSACWMALTASSVFSTAARSPANAEWSSSLISIVKALDLADTISRSRAGVKGALCARARSCYCGRDSWPQPAMQNRGCDARSCT